jgi:hypothetical protein
MVDEPAVLKPLGSVDPEGAVVWEGPAVSTNKMYVVFQGQTVRRFAGACKAGEDTAAVAPGGIRLIWGSVCKIV